MKKFIGKNALYIVVGAMIGAGKFTVVDWRWLAWFAAFLIAMAANRYYDK